jgi:dTDP-4-amino-4,6-dideoxygalactose transaminase
MSMTIPFRKAIIPKRLQEEIAASIEAEKFEATEALEVEIAASTHMPYALSASSSTSALHLAMCALDLKRGDKVLCPINGFVDLPEVVRHFDAEPVFVDVLSDGYAIDPKKLAEAAERIKGKKLRAVIVNHPAGLLAPMEAIREVADTYGLKIVEDATEMLGSPLLGRYSDMVVVGLGSKIDNTIDGGVLLVHDEGYYERAKLLRNHAMVYTSEETRYLYDVLDIGCQYRMSEFNALYCRALFAEHPQALERRRAIAQYYFKALGGIKNITLPLESNKHLYTQFIVTVETNRDTFARKLREKGIEVSVQYIPLNFTQYYKEKYGLKVFDFPVALDGYQKMMSLPIYPQMSDEEVAYVCETIKTIAESHR